MASRLVSVILCLALFLSLFYTAVYVGYELFPEAPREESTEVTTEQTEPVEPQLLVFENLRYGTNSRHLLDLSLPVDGRAETGLIIYLHGGGWRSGDKSQAKRSFQAIQPNSDYATASINYRLVKDGTYNLYDILEDITLALDYIKDFAEGYSVNLTRVIFSGHSAGGHLSLLYAYKYKDISPIEPVGVFAASPVPDLSLDAFYTNNTKGNEAYMCKYMSKLFGITFTPETRSDFKILLDEYSPINFINSSTVPTVILHGENDRVAPFNGSQLLCEKLSEYCINHELVVFKNTKHNLNADSEYRQYADKLLLACAKSWFGIADNNK